MTNDAGHSTRTAAERLEALEGRQSELEHVIDGLQRDLELAKQRPTALFWLLVGGGAIAAALVVVDRLPLPRSQLWTEIYNTGHIGLFAVAAWVIATALRRWIGSERPAWPYAVTLLAVLGLGIGQEMLQYLGPRDASIGDIGRDLVGAAFGMAVCFWHDPPARRAAGVLGRGALGLVALTAALCVVVAWPVVATYFGERARDETFPMIADFEADWERETIVGEAGAELTWSNRPPDWEEARGQHVGRVELAEGGYPRVAWLDIYPDWSGYERLVLPVYLEARAPEAEASRSAPSVTLGLRIHDAAHDSSHHDRFNTEVRVTPGPNLITVPLSDVAAAPEGRDLDLSQIAGMALFGLELEQPITLLVDAVRLE